MTRILGLLLAAAVGVSLIGCTQPKATPSNKSTKVEGTKPTGPEATKPTGPMKDDKPADKPADKPGDKPADKPGDKTPPPAVPEKK